MTSSSSDSNTSKLTQLSTSTLSPPAPTLTHSSTSLHPRPSSAELKKFFSKFFHDVLKPAIYAHMVLLSCQKTKRNGNGIQGGMKGNGRGDNGNQTLNNGGDSTSTAQAFFAEMIPELSRVMTENRHTIAQARIEYADFPDLAATFDYFDSQLTAIEESLTQYLKLIEDDSSLAAQITAVETMKDQNDREAQRVFALVK
jgi:hypothetical protein